MDNATLTSSTDATMDRHILEQLMMIRPLLRKDKEGSAAAAADDGGDDDARGDVVEEIAKECMALSKNQSKDLLLAVLLDVLLLHLLDDEEEGRVEVSSSEASDQQLMDNAAAAKKKKRAAAAAKKKRNKRNKAAAKYKHKRGSKRMTWLGNGIIPRIIMVVFGSITTLIVAFSLIYQSDGSGNVKVPPALRPSTITSLRQRDLQSSGMPSTPPNIMSPSPVPVVAQAPTPIFSPTPTPTAIERNALSDFHNSTGGPEWTDRSQWLDESTSYCYWFGVVCDVNGHVIKLILHNNGLSGRLSESIGNLTYIEVLDLSDNDIKGLIPAEIGKLSNLEFLRLSHNAFTGAVPDELGELKGLHLLHLQSNRITQMPNIPRLNDNIYGPSTFVADCGVPYIFEELLACENCTMCCNANDDCTRVGKWGLNNYLTFTALLYTVLFSFCCLIALLLREIDKRNNRRNPLTPEMEARLERDDKYALSKICSDSVYSYFLTDNVFGWLVALFTLVLQLSALAIIVSIAFGNLRDDTTIFKLTWQCPLDTVMCKDKSGVTGTDWFIFFVITTAFLSKDLISGCKLIYHSAKVRHLLKPRIRYFFAGMCLISITLTVFYASAVYNQIISASSTELIVNSVIILFVMNIDEWIFSALTAWNEKWTVHAKDDTIDEMKKEIALQGAQIESHQEELRKFRKAAHKIISRYASVIQTHNRWIRSMRLARNDRLPLNGRRWEGK